MKPIKILGAGPSGLAAAMHLVRAGRSVEVYEREKDVGMRFKGDIQGLENWSEKGEVLNFLNEMGLRVNFDCDPFDALSISNGERQWQFKTNKPAFYMVKRGNMEGSFDIGLKEQALEAGVKIHFGATLDKSEADILATGPNTREVFAVDTGIVFETEMEDMTVGIVHDEAGYKGYAYLLVTNGYGCMCTYLGDRFKQVNQCFNRAKEMFGELVELDIQNPVKVGGIGSFSLKNRFLEPGTMKSREGEKQSYRSERGQTGGEGNGNLLAAGLRVGEAAGLQDLLWGFGIRTALISGKLAARSIVEGLDYPALARQHFRKKLKASLVNRYFWEKFGSGNYGGIVDRIHGAIDPLKYLHSFHNFNLLQRLFYPVALKYCRKKYGQLKL